jgi:hypothetical protein
MPAHRTLRNARLSSEEIASFRPKIGEGSEFTCFAPWTSANAPFRRTSSSWTRAEAALPWRRAAPTSTKGARRRKSLALPSARHAPSAGSDASPTTKDPLPTKRDARTSGTDALPTRRDALTRTSSASPRMKDALPEEEDAWTRDTSPRSQESATQAATTAGLLRRGLQHCRTYFWTYSGQAADVVSDCSCPAQTVATWN